MPTQWRKSPYVVRLNSRRLSTGPSKAKRQAYYDGLTKPLSDAIILALFGNGEEGAYYDPYDLTDEKLAWRRNLLLWSNTFNNPYWDQQEVSIESTSVPAPNGGFATKVTKLSGNVVRLQKNNTGVNGQVRSIYARTVSGTGTVAMLGFHGANSQYIRTLTTEWQRFEAPVNTSEAGGAVFYCVDFRAGTLNELLIADAQLEVGSTATEVQRITDFNSDFMAQFPSHTLFQDSAGTIPVTGHMQPVGRVLDKSGNSANATQSISAARPLWQNNNGIKTFYRDGVDDALNVTLSAATYTRIVANTGTGYATNTVVHGGGALNILGSGAGNSAGYILIDRELTPTEAANVEALFNQRAGI